MKRNVLKKTPYLDQIRCLILKEKHDVFNDLSVLDEGILHDTN